MPAIKMTLLLSLMVLVGCANTSVYVLDQKEIVRVKSGQNVTASYDGWILSDRAVQRVMDAKVKGANLQ